MIYVVRLGYFCNSSFFDLMTGKIHSFESFGTVDGPGIRFVVFMQGCPMRCKYCHNPDTWDFSGGSEYSARQVAEKALKYKHYIQKGGGVTVSGGEPLMQAEFVRELFTILKREGVHTALDTSGINFDRNDETLKDLLSVTDLVLLDIKHIDENEHKKLTGQTNAKPLAFAQYLSEIGKDIIIRHVLVPGITDNDENLKKLHSFISQLKTVKAVEVLPYHTMGEVKYEKMGITYPLKGVNPPDKSRIENAKNILRGEL